MENIKDKFEGFSENKLIDVVQNYKQYGYPEDYRIIALDILYSRGIDKETLILRGQFENQTFNAAESSYLAFNRNSKIAFLLYFLSLTFLFVLPLFLGDTLTTLLIFGCSIGYLIFLIVSFIHQSNFYKSIQKSQLTESPILFLLAGMPFYFILYFYVKGKMRSQLSIIQ